MVKYYDIKVLLQRISKRNNRLKAANINDVRNTLYELCDAHFTSSKQLSEIHMLEYKISAAIKNNKKLPLDSYFFINIDEDSNILDNLYEEHVALLGIVADNMDSLNSKFKNYGMRARFSCYNCSNLDEDAIENELDFFVNQFSINGERLIKTLHYQNGRDYENVERKQQERLIFNLFDEAV